MMIVEGPQDPYDVAGWEAAIETLKANRESMQALTYDAQLENLTTGLAAARHGRPTLPPAHSLREALRKTSG